MTQHIHRGTEVFAFPTLQVRYWLCWCGAMWLCPPLTHASRWCPEAPVGMGFPLPASVLCVQVVQPDWAANSMQPYAVSVQVGGVGTMFAQAATQDRALLVAHALEKTYAGKAAKFREAWAS